MSKINQTTNPTVTGDGTSTTAQRRPAPGRVLSHAELSNVMGRARRMQVRAIASPFTNLGK